VCARISSSLGKHICRHPGYREKWPDAPLVANTIKNGLSTRSKKRWDKLSPEQRTAIAKKQWTPKRKITQSATMRNVRLGLTGLTPEELEEWKKNSSKAADTPEVRKS
jgi:hypothetical protein